MHSRLSKLQEQLKDLRCDALLLEDSLSLLYLTQLHLSAGKLLVTANSAQLLVDGRYFESSQAKSPCPVVLYEEGVLESTLKAAGIGRLAVSSEDTTYKRFSQLTEDLQKLSITITGIDNPVKKLRTIKDTCELELLREAARLGSRGYDLVCDLLEEGISEIDLAKELELFWLRQGGKKTCI
jgi:Xaa-Pro aminopeptidase